MALFDRQAVAARSLRVLAMLLGYPDAQLRGRLPALREALHGERALSMPRLHELEALIDSIARAAPLDAEAAYVEVFDRGRASSLYLFEHVHGDSRDRGPAMVDLVRTYEQAGLFLAPNQLPDYLPVVLEFVSTQPPREARAFLGEIAHILNAIFAALQKRGSAYAGVLGALLELAGERAQALKLAAEEALDETWEEPAAFEGCSPKGQSLPGQPQPVHVVRKPQVRDGARQ